MKARRSSPKFKPVEITLTIESQEEAQALYAIFNYTPNCDLLPEDAPDKIRAALGDYAVRGTSPIANGITYAEFYRNKERSQTVTK